MWSSESADICAIRLFAYADSWENLPSAWEDDVFTVMIVAGNAAPVH